MRRAVFPTLLLLSTLLGCSEEPSQQRGDGPVEGSAAVVAQPEVQRVETPAALTDRWLTFKDTQDPIAWVSRFDAAPDAASAARREAILQVIDELDERYLEDPRMLANRTVQLQNMLQEIGLHEDMLTLLRGFATLTRGEQGREDQFGEKVAFYVRLRGEGATHHEALERIQGGAALVESDTFPVDGPGVPPPAR